MHPASIKFPPVDKLSTVKLQEIVDRAPKNFLLRTPREIEALRELRRRETIR